MAKIVNQNQSLDSSCVFGQKPCMVQRDCRSKTTQGLSLVHLLYFSSCCVRAYFVHCFDIGLCLFACLHKYHKELRSFLSLVLTLYYTCTDITEDD